ncbi:MAG: hypothetical protein FJZ38_26370 [Candidatus Rokubacteria bacterium]|nr:hypothetical protein [Candidatus Rokubacteria bacterium]
MKRRLTFLAAAVVLVDLFAFSAAWHVSPTLSLTVGLAVPEVEQILAPLYPEPVREDIASGELHRPTRLRSALVLTGESADVRLVARALGVPVRVESVASFRDVEARATVSGRATSAWRLLRFSHDLLTAS